MLLNPSPWKFRFTPSNEQNEDQLATLEIRLRPVPNLLTDLEKSKLVWLQTQEIYRILSDIGISVNPEDIRSVPSQPEARKSRGSDESPSYNIESQT